MAKGDFGEPWFVVKDRADELGCSEEAIMVTRREPMRFKGAGGAVIESGCYCAGEMDKMEDSDRAVACVTAMDGCNLGEDGKNLPRLFQSIHKRRYETHPMIVAALRDVAPFMFEEEEKPLTSNSGGGQYPTGQGPFHGFIKRGYGGEESNG